MMHPEWEPSNVVSLVFAANLEREMQAAPGPEFKMSVETIWLDREVNIPPHIKTIVGAPTFWAGIARRRNS